MLGKPTRIFDTDKRIRLGIWGLGRGMSFYKTCRFLNIDVAAGCDFNAHMRRNFQEHNPDAFVTDNADEFLARDFDAVLLATYCTTHGPDAIKCLRAGKHVLAEVTAFHTMAEGVQLVEEVEKRGLVYNLAENYPFSAANMYLARKWREGLFGQLQYAEFEYVHECRSLCYTYIDGVPVKPGNTVHHWRSWLNFHYYCTHSLGPVMVITGTRPVRVVSLPCEQTLPGYLMNARDGMGGATPSLIQMNNGGLVRNLMGATTNDSHIQRLWGTLGSAEMNTSAGLLLRLGGSGHSPKFEVKPSWDKLGELAAQTGHGGGDFWVLYYFARQILTGEKAPFDIYSACDVTIPGILAYRSSVENGKPYDVPDFRDPQQRERWRNDHFDQPRFDTKKGVFPPDADIKLTQHFSHIIADLIECSTMVRAYTDWKKVHADMSQPAQLLPLAETVLEHYPKLRETYEMARNLADVYPQSHGARVLNEMLALGEEKFVRSPNFRSSLTRSIAALRRKYPTDQSQTITAGEVSPLLPKVKDIRRARLPAQSVRFTPISSPPNPKYLDIRSAHQGKDGLVYVRAFVEWPKAGAGQLTYSSDGPFRVWVNKKAIDAVASLHHPAPLDKYSASITWKKGRNEILFAILTQRGETWGVAITATLLGKP